MEMREGCRPVPGMPGYTVDEHGTVYSRRGHALVPQVRRPKKGSAYNRVKVCRRGKWTYAKVAPMVAAAWLGYRPRAGYAVMHVRDVLDDSAENLKVVTVQELGIRKGAMARQRGVLKLDGDVPVDSYPSARAAARTNAMSYQTVIDRCNDPGGFKRPEAPDGYRYIWDDTVRASKLLALAEGHSAGYYG